MVQPTQRSRQDAQADFAASASGGLSLKFAVNSSTDFETENAFSALSGTHANHANAFIKTRRLSKNVHESVGRVCPILDRMGHCVFNHLAQKPRAVMSTRSLSRRIAVMLMSKIGLPGLASLSKMRLFSSLFSLSKQGPPWRVARAARGLLSIGCQGSPRPTRTLYPGPI